MIINPILPINILSIICFILIIVVLFKTRNFKRKIVDLLIIILIFTINLRIMIPTNNSIIMSNNFDILFVIDTTISMNAEDYDGNNTRLDGVKKDCRYIINKLNGSRFSIITFNDISRRIIPFTDDYDLISSAIDSIQVTNNHNASGSSLNTPYDTIEKTLSVTKNKNRQLFMFFISDGEITNKETLKSYQGLAKFLNNGVVMGYGSETGGKMKIKKFSNLNYEEYIYTTINGKKEIGISKIDEKNLKKIATDMKIDYIHMNNSSNIDYKIDELLQTLIVKPEEKDLEWYDDIYYYFLLPLIFLFICKFYLIRRG